MHYSIHYNSNSNNSHINDELLEGIRYEDFWTDCFAIILALQLIITFEHRYYLLAALEILNVFVFAFYGRVGDMNYFKN